MKITGAEIAAFLDEWSNIFGSDFYLDDPDPEIEDLDGNVIADPQREYDTRMIGYITWQGYRHPTEPFVYRGVSFDIRREKTWETLLDDVIRLWRDDKTVVIAHAVVSQEDAKRLRDYLADSPVPVTVEVSVSA